MPRLVWNPITGEFDFINTGDVVGPSSSTDNAIARFDGTTGKFIQNSGVTVDDSDNVTTAGGVKFNNASGKDYELFAGTIASDERLIFRDQSGENSRFWFDSTGGTAGFSIAEGGNERVYVGTEGGDVMFETKSTFGFKVRTQGGAERFRIEAGGNININDNGDSVDVRIESDSDANLFFTDGSADKIGIGTNTPTAKLDVNSDTIRLRTARTPSSASDAGNAGDIAWDANYVYVCVATNTWKRSALSTW